MCDLVEAAEIIRQREARPPRPQFRNPVARDAAWGRYFRRMGLRAVERVTRRPRPTPTNAERIESWRQKYARTTIEQQVGA